MDVAIRTDGLTKAFGSFVALDGLDLEIQRGEVFGYIGPNGAGKSVTIRLLLDLLRPTKGHAEVFGMDVRRQGIAVRRRLGYLAGELALYEQLTGRQALRDLARLRGGVDEAYVEELGQRFGLPFDKPIHDLSKGNKQKVGLIQAFMHRPEILILDEPTSGLDPLLQRTFHELVVEVAADGTTVLMSSHVLSELEHVADRVAMIRAGKLLAVERIEDLKRTAPHRVAVTFAAPVGAEELAGVPGVDTVDVRGSLARFTVHGTMDPVIKAIARHDVVTLTAEEPDLEELFIDLYEADA
ncbi:MAG TPA: ABC transporter ATP-binding protein [Solirubrobacteraceae bacterium]|nr:ABC transporter ATP-binding protein [Solirubrobacteraceae bacterium]